MTAGIEKAVSTVLLVQSWLVRCCTPLYEVTAAIVVVGDRTKGVGAHIGQVQAQIHVDDGKHQRKASKPVVHRVEHAAELVGLRRCHAKLVIPWQRACRHCHR